MCVRGLSGSIEADAIQYTYHPYHAVFILTKRRDRWMMGVFDGFSRGMMVVFDGFSRWMMGMFDGFSRWMMGVFDGFGR